MYGKQLFSWTKGLNLYFKKINVFFISQVVEDSGKKYL